MNHGLNSGIKAGVGKAGETGESKLDFESMRPKNPFPSFQSNSHKTHERPPSEDCCMTSPQESEKHLTLL